MVSKLLLATTLAAAVFAIPNAAPGVQDADTLALQALKQRQFDAAISARDEPNSLVARACDYDVGCFSATGSGISAGKYCGFCKQVLGPFNVKHIYQVNGKSGSKTCCDYGTSNACAAHWPSVSPNVLVNCKNNGRGY